MKFSIGIKCPVCQSKDITMPNSWMTWLYSVKPIKCDDCSALFEASIVTRLFLWVNITLILIFATHSEIVEGYFGKAIAGQIAITLISSFFILPVIGAIIEVFKPWQYTLWNDFHLKRKIINYGSELSMIIYGIYFALYIVKP